MGDGAGPVAAAGRSLGGRYELLGLLATGGMGQVWRGRDTLLGRPVAVKVLHPGLSGDPSFLVRFRAEAQHAAQLNHPNVAAVHDYGEQPDGAGGAPVAYLVMELVEGESLAAVLQRQGRLDVAATLSVVRQTAAALAVAHAAGVVHRDVKPGNVLIRPDGVVKVTDFGIAWSTASAPLTRTGQVIGTAHYLSPEQADGGTASPASDVYALGVVTYECLAGRRPFDGELPVQVLVQHLREVPPPLPAGIPGPVRELVERAMVKDPARRIPDAAAFAADVDRVLAAGVPGADATTALLPAAAHGTGPRPTAVLPAGSGPGSRRTALLVAAVALVALVLGVAVVAGTRSGSTGPSTAPRTPAPSSSAAPSRVPVDAAALVGRPLDQVSAQLRALGLVPVPSPTPTTGAPAGQVIAVAPAGLLAPGQQVTLTYATTPAPPATTAPGRGHGKDDGEGGD